MSLLESVIGGVVGQVFGGQRGGAMSPLVKALLMLLLAKGASGGLGDLFGRGHAAPEPAGGAGPFGRDPGRHRDEAGGPDTGDIGGFGQYRGPRGPQPEADTSYAGDPTLPPGDFSDLSGMLGGDDAPARPSQGQVSHEAAGGLDDLVDRFHRGGLGDRDAILDRPRRQLPDRPGPARPRARAGHDRRAAKPDRDGPGGAAGAACAGVAGGGAHAHATGLGAGGGRKAEVVMLRDYRSLGCKA